MKHLANHRLFALLAVAFAVFGCIGVLVALQRRGSEQADAVAGVNDVAARSRIITIPMDSFAGGQWDNRGPTRELRGSNLTSVWMANSGWTTYNFIASDPLPDGDISISVLLSSELMPDQERIDDPTLTSDVTLLVNNQEPQNSTQNVIKDTGGASRRYTWTVPTRMLAPGGNTLTFQIKRNAIHAHGITVFSPITLEFPETAVTEGTIPANQPWTFVGKFKGKISVVLSGQAVINPKLGPSGPDGVALPGTGNYALPGANQFCALVKYNDKIEKLGTHRDFFFASDTDLYIGPNDEPGHEGAGFADNSGSWGYKIIFVR